MTWWVLLLRCHVRADGWQTRRMRPQLEARTWRRLLLRSTEEDLGFVERFIVVAETA